MPSNVTTTFKGSRMECCINASRELARRTVEVPLLKLVEKCL